ncbi:DNA-directed RNA polymerase subunit delta [Bacillus songklensis]|uniref:Probable DNA-directed RNA polymerase subunit delta n=1 Tax=Bacillus songklensis TaxID=1069116 RepID=A0ABV8B7S7_9BACI
MLNLSLAQYSKEQLQEMSMLELAYLIFSGKSERSAVPFKELLDEITSVLDLSEDEVKARIAQFYTDLNIDGRFISTGDNHWGLRSWYPYDQIDEEVLPVAKPKKKKAKKVVDEDSEDFGELEDEDLDFNDLDDYDDDDDIDEELEDEDFDNVDSDEFDDDVIDDDDYDLDDEELEDDEDYEDTSDDDEEL